MKSSRDQPLRSVRADMAEDGRTLHGHFSVFNEWYRIDSVYEGTFMERVAPGAFRDVFRDPKREIRVIFQHGSDPSVGLKPLGRIRTLEEDKVGARYEAELFTEASYVADLLPALRAGQLGSSFKFKVGGERWVDHPKRSDANPEGIPERTITEVSDLWEFGPVTWGANPAATAGVRSFTDDYYTHLLNDPLFVARLTERAGLGVVENLLLTAKADGRARDEETPDVEPDGPKTTGHTIRELLRDAGLSHLLNGGE